MNPEFKFVYEFHFNDGEVILGFMKIPPNFDGTISWMPLIIGPDDRERYAVIPKESVKYIVCWDRIPTP